MRLRILIICVVTLIAFGPDVALAKGGKGGGKGGGGRPSFAGGKGGGGSTQQSKGGGGKLATAPSGKEHKEFKEHKEHKELKEHKDHKDKLADSGKTNDKLAKKDGSFPTDSGETYNKKQKQLEIEQRNRDKRLAQAEHLRQIAERNGNEQLAANADRMEAFAHDHYARRVAQLEKFGVTDPALDPGGVIDPLNDPAGEFPELPLVPDLPPLPELPRLPLLPRLLP
ncbi:MAG TPA: hypothetical protein VFB80_16840 [Pirellulaceae bacterium]|nr:hypothetical protein [Pirellulaceae bacterium]